ncbi:hypothetical protein BJY00DRAFT_41513 [Aspergillus carlsbadensis]|nr:hypothetical protein BJY00DRAFT_41513 [Aspergillus carlsbadensis]
MPFDRSSWRDAEFRMAQCDETKNLACATAAPFGLYSDHSSPSFRNRASRWTALSFPVIPLAWPKRPRAHITSGLLSFLRAELKGDAFKQSKPCGSRPKTRGMFALQLTTRANLPHAFSPPSNVFLTRDNGLSQFATIDLFTMSSVIIAVSTLLG